MQGNTPCPKVSSPSGPGSGMQWKSHNACAAAAEQPASTRCAVHPPLKRKRAACTRRLQARRAAASVPLTLRPPHLAVVRPRLFVAAAAALPVLPALQLLAAPRRRELRVAAGDTERGLVVDRGRAVQQAGVELPGGRPARGVPLQRAQRAYAQYGCEQRGGGPLFSVGGEAGWPPPWNAVSLARGTWTVRRGSRVRRALLRGQAGYALHG
jgi:hypothetical protein